MDNPSTSQPVAVLPTPVAQEPVTTHKFASFPSRVVATILDGIILGIPIAIVIAIFSALLRQIITSSNLLNLIVQLVSFCILGLVHAHFHHTKGQTPGKKMLHIKVVDEVTAQYPTFKRAFLRSTVGAFADMIVPFLGLFWALVDKKKQTFHDKVAHTIVIEI